MIYGLYPLNDVDTQKMADGAESYEIKTQTTFMDGLNKCFWGGNLLSARTVTVTKWQPYKYFKVIYFLK